MKTKAIPAALTFIIILAGCKKDNSKAAATPGPINYNDYANGGVHLEIVNSDPADYNDNQLYVGVIGATTGSNSQSASSNQPNLLGLFPSLFVRPILPLPISRQPILQEVQHAQRLHVVGRHQCSEPPSCPYSFLRHLRRTQVLL